MVDVADVLDVNPAKGISTRTTPSGIEIYFQHEPVRLYRLNGVRVPSVTDVLDILHKQALVWWGMKVGMVGALELAALAAEKDGNLDNFALDFFGTSLEDLSDRDHPLLELMKKHELTTNDRKEAAGSRGTSVHNALENWARTGHLPSVDDYPDEERGYIQGLLGFLAEAKLEPLDVEIMVGSVEFEFAGRFDLRARTEEHILDRGYRRRKRTVPAGKGIWDLKTSKGIFDTHHLQTAGYRLALEEGGDGRSDYEAILNVQADGSWDVKFSDKKPHDFLAVRQAYGAVK